MRERLKILFVNYGFYLVPFLVSLLVIILFVKVDLPKLRETNTIRQELVGIKERLARLSAKSKFLSSLDGEKLKSDLAKVTLVLPDGKDAPSILRTLEASASISGVLVENLDLAPGKLATPSAKEESKEILIKVGLSGTTASITTFLEKLTLIGRAMEIRKLEVSFPEGTASAKLNLDLVAYFLLANFSANREEPLPIWGREQEILERVLEREIPSLSPVSSGGKTDLFK